VLRAVRLLNHAGSLKQIVYAMFASILPVANSFILLTLIMCIYATMGVNLFGDEVCDCQHEKDRRTERQKGRFRETET
jgi:hypothetical protein